MSVFTGYPLSRESIHISRPEIDDELKFTTSFFSDAQGVDIKKDVWAYKKQHEIFRRMETYRGDFAMLHPPFSSNSNAALIQLNDKACPNVTDIMYTSEDDKVIGDYLRRHVETTWHSLGTRKMGPRENKCMVYSNLSVYGLNGLKTADLSIAPRNVAANRLNTTLAIAEKAADVFIEELGL